MIFGYECARVASVSGTTKLKCFIAFSPKHNGNFISWKEHHSAFDNKCWELLQEYGQNVEFTIEEKTLCFCF
jgi:hypothetical protein